MSRIRRTPAQIKADADLKFRICRKCKEEKPIEEYRTGPRFADGIHTQCKICTDSNSEEHRQNNLEFRRNQSRARTMKHKFGLTLEEYEDILKSQNECCALCDKHYSNFKIRLAVDHDHHSGEIRGLLCTNCNHRLIARHRDGVLLRKMADYVEQGIGKYVPIHKKRNKRKTK